MSLPKRDFEAFSSMLGRLFSTQTALSLHKSVYL